MTQEGRPFDRLRANGFGRSEPISREQGGEARLSRTLGEQALRARQIGNTITVWGDGHRLTTFRDGERPYFNGTIGLYTEDAAVDFSDVRVVRP